MRIFHRFFGARTGSFRIPRTSVKATVSHAISGPSPESNRAVLTALERGEDRDYCGALALLNSALSSDSGSPHLRYAKGRVLFQAGRYWEAHNLFLDLRRSGFRDPEMARHLGWSYLALGQSTEAEACMRETCASKPDDWQSYYGLGEVLRVRDPRAAIAAFNQALELSTDNLHCLLNLCTCHLVTEDGYAAEANARHAIRAAHECAAAWTNLGVALLMQNRAREANDALCIAERLPGWLEDGSSDLNRGIALRLMGRTQEAIDYYEQLLPHHPSVGAHGHYALALLTAGRLVEGWEQYEFRWLEPLLSSQRGRYKRPVWDGQDLNGKVILVQCEQGVGDVIQFIRYAPMLQALGATVLLELRPGLGTLAAAFPGIDRSYPHGKVAEHFDYCIGLMSLARGFGTTLATIPASIPYLQVPAKSFEKWRHKISKEGAICIGLVWAGDPRHPRDRERSIPLDLFESLVSLPGTRWLSLQKGASVKALLRVPFRESIVDLDADIDDYSDTAAVIENLDLIVSVDTSVAHLAGALGKAVWTLLPFSADWRWLEHRMDSPWYPTMRLFRREESEGWPDVIVRLRAALVEAIGDRAVPFTKLSMVDSKDSMAAGQNSSSMRGEKVMLGIAKASQTRFGMIQYVPGTDAKSMSIEYYGEYMQVHVDLLACILKPGCVALEVEAGVGLHAIAMARLLAPDGQVLAIEASPVLRRIFEQNVRANEVKCVSLLPLAACEMSLDQLQLDKIDVLKINEPSRVRGVLDGASETVWRHRPVLLINQNAADELAVTLQQTRDFGYRCWCVSTPLFSPTNFNNRTVDLFDGEVLLALLAIPEERDADVTIPINLHITALA